LRLCNKRVSYCWYYWLYWTDL